MICPYCASDKTKVIDKRDISGITKRRRECLKCERRFNTYENVEKVDIMVIKKDGRREKFDESKFRRGIERAFEKRPVSSSKIENMIRLIEEQLRKKGDEVKSNVIGELIMKELKKIDKVAYIRFASVYREFEDISDFKKEIKGLLKDKKKD